MKEIKKTICNRDCPDACAILATVENGRVTNLQGDPEHPVTQGFLCYRTNQFLTRQYSPERLKTPLYRKNDTLVPISWDEALDIAADRLSTIKKESGPEAIFHYRSGGSLGLLKMVPDYFFEKFGPVTIKRGDICSGAGEAAQTLDFGDSESSDVFDLLHAKQILLWGKNVYTSSPHLLPILREARQKGTQITLIDPVWQKSAKLCETIYQPRPGGDFALAMATAKILRENDWLSPNARNYCDHWKEFWELVESQTLETWCQDADVEKSVPLDLARRLGPESPTTILVGWGMGRRQNGASIIRALDALGAITENIGRKGSGVSFYFNRRKAFDTSWIKGLAVAPRSICEPLFGKEILATNSPKIRAVWITAGNPVAMLPESETNARALSSREFVVVVDSFLTDTAKLATLVLPTTTLLEDDDLLGAYGHHWIGASRPVVAPPHNVKSDVEIIRELAKRFKGLSEEFSLKSRAWKQKFFSEKLRNKGLTVEQLEKQPIRNPLSENILFSEKNFNTPNRKVQLLTTGAPNASKSSHSKEYPLWFLSLSTKKSQSSQWAKPQEEPPELRIHPSASNGIPNGAICRVASKIGSLCVRLFYDEKQRKDVAIIPKGGEWHRGHSPNALIQAKLTDIGEGGALYDEKVRLLPLEN